MFKYQLCKNGNYEIFDNFDHYYQAGKDEKVVKDVVKLLNESHRPNIEYNGNDLVACLNNHDKGQPCEYETLIEDVR